MDIYYNGKIYKNDGSPLADTALAVMDGRIAAVGKDDEILALDCGHGERVDLDGKLVMPGFVDSHMHLLEYAFEKSFIDLSGARSLEEMLSMLKASLAGASSGRGFLLGTGFNQNYWKDPVMPSRTDLDSVSQDVPVAAHRTCHHVTVCNTPALRFCGLEESHPDGILREDDQYILEASLPPLTSREVKDLIAGAIPDALSKGITEIHTDDLTLIQSELYGETIINAFTELDREGRLPVRIYEQCNLPSAERLKAFLGAGFMTGMSSGKFTIGPLKLLGDGALGAGTAALTEPYAGDPGNRGILNFSDEELSELVSLANRAGMQIAIHGIGDRCIDQILDAYEKALREFPRNEHRHGIVHCQITRPEQLERMKALGVMAYIQPVFLKADRHIAEARVGKELASTSYDWRKMLDMGIRLSGGSDCPVEPFDVMPNMYYAIKRKAPGEADGWFPEKGLSFDEAVRLFTSDGAYASLSGNRRGRLLPGFDADFCVIDRDITSLPPEALNEAQVLMTAVGGSVVYTG